MTKTAEAARPAVQLDADSLLETIRLKQREIGIGVIVIAAVAVIGWFWHSSAVQKDERADRALNLAANSYYSGNKALAKTDLEKVVARYGSTPGGIQGAMLLAQILYEEAQYDAGIKQLQSIWKSASGGPFAASVEGLIAAGYADQNKYDDAAIRYLAAADKTTFPADKDFYRAESARVFALAGKKEEARKIWADIASRIDSPALGEAKIRLGELSAAPQARIDRR